MKFKSYNNNDLKAKNSENILYIYIIYIIIILLYYIILYYIILLYYYIIIYIYYILYMYIYYNILKQKFFCMWIMQVSPLTAESL